ncbi:hypothetical protein I302_105116 [Kwoniella bestiolae CBS 10118]|uniref:PH domain-containing protein n=1 Tax=Kwoniella bestiolae CBS 10118 TaxID=1296100 RepID=A0A1B9FS83_9TREE|nr:hypothetical protein I302_08403 [Kwoniella bestiolae CBS 10118]OCF21628.1 hypothetical protein I302_08403 [Kwoniella bestiolae CBS 10118]
MPSIFTRHRRASDAPPLSLGKEDSPARKQRLSIDLTHSNGLNGSPPPSGGKIKAFFGVGASPDQEGKNASLRKKLTSPSSFFKSSADLSTPKTPPAQSPPDPTLARYTDPSPRTRLNGNATTERFASPTLAPETFALASTSSPEGTPRQSKDGRRSSVSWQPSYPLVVPDDEYVNIPPDGQVGPNGLAPAVNIALTPSDENRKRRSLDAGDSLSNWPALQPAAKPITPPISTVQTPVTPPKSQFPLPTPPLSAASEKKKLDGLQPPEQPSGRRRPSLSIDISDVAIPGSTAAIAAAQKEQAKPAASDSIQSAVDPRSTSLADYTRVPLNDISPKASAMSVPSSPINSMKQRPNPPVRKSTLIQSPPMPQPIKNLPTLQGWPGSPVREVSGSTTPGWGALAREGGPKTPGVLGTPSGQRTPGLTGFPFSLPPVGTPLGKNKERSTLTEQEVRKAKRAMPVMLRQPSTQPAHEDEGGEAGDDDDESDGESETEMEGGDDDSDGETETEPRTPSRGAMGLAGRFAKKNKGKAKASSKVSPMAKSVVREEDANGKSVWSLGTPSEKRPTTKWAQFGSPSPRATPGPAPTPGRAALIRNASSYASTAVTSEEGYFDSAPTSQGGTGGTSTPARSDEPTLVKGTGTTELVNSAVVGLQLGQPVAAPPIAMTDAGQDQEDNDASADDDSDSDAGTNEGTNEGSMDSPPMPSQAQQAEPITVQVTKPTAPVRPTPSTRNSMYSQVSRSMINLPPKTAAVEPEPTTDKISVKPRLETVPSGEQVPMRIDLPPRIPEGKVLPNGPATPAEWAKPPPTPAAGLSSFNFWGGGDKKQPALKRRRSADDLMKQPPKYEPPFPGTFIPKPRDEEGREKLPKYWCSVHIEGLLPRKMEFSAPGQQARDRSWKKLYFIIHGTSFYVYKFDPHRFPLKIDAPVPTISEEEIDDSLHVHFPPANERRGSVSSQTSGMRRGSISAVTGGSSSPDGRRGSVPDNFHSATQRRGSTAGSIGGSSGSRRASESASGSSLSVPRRSSLNIVTNASDATSTSSDLKDPKLFPSSGNNTTSPRRGSTSNASSSTSTSGGTSLASHFQHNSLVKQYSLQNAESGLAADYHKRKNVVRVRVNGEQFLLQTGDNREVVAWIEAFQAATNVSLDLDVRPMPKIITLPRRRRRRGAAAAAAARTATDANGSAANGTDDTPAGNAQAAARAVSAADAAERERERMLVEDQQAEVVG